MTEFDVVIVGGGLVGSSLAIALEESPLRVALIESAAPKANAQPSYDERNLALSRATANALKALRIWPHVAARATPIRKIHVSRLGEFGAARLEAQRHGVDDFGAVIVARELGNGLLARLDECRKLTRHAPATVASIAHENHGVVVTVRTSDAEHRLRTKLIVGADGTESFVRSSLGIDVERFDYEQTAFVTTVTTERIADTAYERFTSTGPLAILPLGDRRVGIVLTVPTLDADHISACDDAQFLDILHDRFGWRLGRFSRVGRRVSYPLRRVQAQRLVARRGVLVGNAAQTLHPIAAQGFNLGLRDALTLRDLVRAAADAGDANVLAEYVSRRAPDRDDTLAMSDRLARLTRDDAPPLKLLRSLGLLVLDRFTPLQAAVVRRGMGFGSAAPELALEKAG